MGADLYINEIYEENRSRYEPLFVKAVDARNAAKSPEQKELLQAEVEKYYALIRSVGYYRDSYNGTNVLNHLGLSWWQDITPLQNKQGDISVRNVKKFLAMIEPLPVPPLTVALAKERRLKIDKTDSIAIWNIYFQDGKAELIAFLKKAIELKKPVHASL